MRVNKRIATLAAAVTVAVTLSGCAAANVNREGTTGDENITENILNGVTPVEPGILTVPPAEELPATLQNPASQQPTTQNPATPEPQEKVISYISVTSSGVKIRSGAGTEYTALGTAEKSTLYAFNGESGGWYKTQYKNKTAYISKQYCNKVALSSSGNEEVEAVIAEGAKLLGTPYVYGAVRLHDGNGHMCKGFTVNEFDCSSLMQYMFYKGAGKLLQVNTRTQIYQGTTVSKSGLKRGDLMFFTNASRKNNTGIERVGHVAIYLGDNYILHTASDYAKIEELTPLRWSYFIQGQRI